jgi:hypothetical protein
MRKFLVYLDKNIPGVSRVSCPVEMPDNATDQECEQVLQETLDTLIANELNTGWVEYGV